MEYTKFEAEMFSSNTTEVRLFVSSLSLSLSLSLYSEELRLKCSVDTYKLKQGMNIRLT
jgi:hypothetical protein